MEREVALMGFIDMERETTINNFEIIDLISINDFKVAKSEINFYVADYQRGYRWEAVQIMQLLNDINENPIGKTYCLQPLMLTKKESVNDNIQFEVIDGQQRLTTLFIILKVLNKRGKAYQLPFTIDYATRKPCIAFLKNIDSISFVAKKEEIEERWYNISKTDQNVDNYHLFNSYQTISLWFDYLKIDENKFLEKVIKDVKLIWYPVVVSASSNAKKLFRNINSGKIRLTSSDLIKALFVLHFQDQNIPISTRNNKKVEFSNQWNEIEKQLNQDDFWFFINNGKNEKYATRIALLFDIITNCTESKSNYASYLKYADHSEDLDWKKVVDLFRKIHEWYTDERYYHRIGFLVNSGQLSFYDIVKLYKKNSNQPKSYFYNELEEKITEYKSSIDLNKINYKSDPFTCKIVLLLYNILLFEKDFPKQKFPFDMYVNEEWSLEHIHPQNPQDFKKIEDVKFWLQDTKKTLNQKYKEGEHLPVVDKIDVFIAGIEDENTPYNKERKELIKEIKDLLDTELATHKISNLSLLDKATNSKLGNALFKNKREIVLKINNSKLDNYVPYATVNCFVKRFSGKDNLQNEFWSEADADSYMDNIKAILYGE